MSEKFIPVQPATTKDALATLAFLAFFGIIYSAPMIMQMLTETSQKPDQGRGR